ncbi:hypothetical protein PAJL_441 [Cutibacterium acnes HL042PA3]|nr:hypothetical protein HMPREF9578_00285 [Cutibacterium acnes HL110PA4]ESK59850.1 hypothetical protein PAJL_441 [Cutibacterium acnes HL042PA3]MCW5114910.1 hypothetical protein [Cutibacterium acnes P05]
MSAVVGNIRGSDCGRTWLLDAAIPWQEKGTGESQFVLARG